MTSIFAPNYTQIPNVIFDYWMHELTHTQFKVLLVICRKTFGWHKNQDNISVKQICESTHVSRAAVFTAITFLEEKKLVEVIRSKTKFGDSEANGYRINVIEINSGSPTIGPRSSSSGGEVVQNLDQGGSPTIGPTKESPNTKETIPEGIDTPPSKIPFREHVLLSRVEHEKLKQDVGEEVLEKMLDALDAFKESSGKKYQSDYGTMKKGGWVRQKVLEESFKSKSNSSKQDRRSIEVKNGKRKSEYEDLF